MPVKDTRVKSFTALHKAFDATHTGNTVYRGVKSLDYKLVPKVGRVGEFRLKRLKIGQKTPPTLRDHEQRILSNFKSRALPHLERVPTDDWEWLAIGQHFGLATRLLDWTRSALVAAYFAVEEEHDDASVVYAFGRGFFDYQKCSPFDVKGIKKIYPANFTRRIEAQSGVFTVHEDSTKPLEKAEPNKLHRIIIDKSFRDELRSLLARYEIHRATLFPDLDGIAFYVNADLVKSWR
jgi:hypothetical protein